MAGSWEGEFADVLASVPEEHFNRDRFVPASGPVDSPVMLIGEAPGATEIELKAPFTGRSGEVLDDALERAGIDRSSLYVTAVVKVRPPDNRDPHQPEIDAWRPVLVAERARIDPDVLVTLGRIAAHEVLQTNDRMADLRGRIIDQDGGATVLPTYHPAATLYDRSKLPAFRRDIASLGRLLAQL